MSCEDHSWRHESLPHGIWPYVSYGHLPKSTIANRDGALEVGPCFRESDLRGRTGASPLCALMPVSLHSFGRWWAGHRLSHPSTAGAPHRKTLSGTPVPYARADSGRPPAASCRSAVRMPECMPSGRVFRTYSYLILMDSAAKIVNILRTAK